MLILAQIIYISCSSFPKCDNIKHKSIEDILNYTVLKYWKYTSERGVVWNKSPLKYSTVLYINATSLVWIYEILSGPNLSVKLFTKNYLTASVVAFEYGGAYYVTIFTYLGCYLINDF